jgi:hypothetical protein
MAVIGFTFDKQDKTKRIPSEYGSQEERLWCECNKLVDAELWEEADKKFQDCCELDSGFINKCDYRLVAKINCGLAKTTGEDKHIRNATQTLFWAASREQHEEISSLFDELCKAYVNKHVPLRPRDEKDETSSLVPSFKDAKTADLKTVVLQLIALFRKASDISWMVQDCAGNGSDTIHCIVDELLERQEIMFVEKKVIQNIGTNNDSLYSGLFRDVVDNWKQVIRGASKKV